ncbi:hypothetical protein [Pseudoroseomonas ludipueritiae]|uniref:Uncharacterized protein n=1 Tax=Pseudoroseomonas ludipueritiae TaxID=198093 RepID=A0ABR7RD61_9PROT|nr:hypothetical protein [Pseudoroseomonas ludipueritiae]MBC9179583.1 hypothetical protein [Pseudoroseomonas ludipueritiae]
MQLEGVEKLVAAAGTALAAILTPIGVIYAASMNRSNKAAEATVASLTAENERLEEKLEKAQAEREYERLSGLRWYQIALWWFHAAHEMRRHTLDARQVAESKARIDGEPRPAWNETLDLPGLEDPLPRLPKP